MTGCWGLGMFLTRVDSMAERIYLMGVGLRAGEMAVSWFDWTVHWMAGCWAGRMIMLRANLWINESLDEHSVRNNNT